MNDPTPVELIAIVGLIIVEFLIIIVLLVMGWYWITGMIGNRRYLKECKDREERYERERAIEARRQREQQEEEQLIQRLRNESPLTYDSKTTKPASPRPGA